MRPTLFNALATAAALVAAAPVFAGEHVRTEKVRHADLDLSTEAGKATFERRVAAAVGRVCSIGNERANLALMMAQGRCMAKARAGSEKQVLAAIERRSGVRLAQATAPTLAAPAAR